MVKLMELEEERDALKAEFDQMRIVATHEFEVRLAQLEAEGISSMLACIASHKAFFTAGLARIEEMEGTLGAMQRAVNYVRPALTFSLHNLARTQPHTCHSYF